MPALALLANRAGRPTCLRALWVVLPCCPSATCLPGPARSSSIRTPRIRAARRVAGGRRSLSARKSRRQRRVQRLRSRKLQESDPELADRNAARRRVLVRGKPHAPVRGARVAQGPERSLRRPRRARECIRRRSISSATAAGSSAFRTLIIRSAFIIGATCSRRPACRGAAHVRRTRRRPATN